MFGKKAPVERPHSARSLRAITRARARLLLPYAASALVAYVLWLLSAPLRAPPAGVDRRRSTLELDHRRLRDFLLAADDLGRAHKVAKEEVVYSRYARMYNRVVVPPHTDKPVEYDVVGRLWKGDSFEVVSVVPYDPVFKTFTMIREYNPATKMGAYTFPQGSVEPGKHPSPLYAAIAELGEEARLRCLPEQMLEMLDYPASQDKYQRETVHYFLCTAATLEEEKHWRPRDENEVMEIERNVTVAEVKALIKAGVVQANVIASAYLAIEHLRAVGELPMDC